MVFRWINPPVQPDPSHGTTLAQGWGLQQDRLLLQQLTLHLTATQCSALLYKQLRETQIPQPSLAT